MNRAMLLNAIKSLPIFAASLATAATVTAKNEIDAARPSETIEIKWSDVSVSVPSATPDKIEVTEDGKAIASQVVDADGDGKPDQLVFQTDFEPKQSKTFEIKASDSPQKFESKVFGRYVPERYDDFAWENDKVAFRVYGKALETVEPGSSGIDTWQKLPGHMVINKWYAAAEAPNKMSYHTNHGEGLDGYKVGKGRGDGGAAIWIDGKMYDSGIKGWRTQKVLANGPVRFMAILGYEPFDAKDAKITETRILTLDAGSQLNRIDDIFTSDKGGDLTVGIGLAKHDKPGDAKAIEKDGIIRYWDAADIEKKDTTKDNGQVGTGAVIDPKNIQDVAMDKEQTLILAKAKSGEPVRYWAGSCWDRAGEIKDVAAWDQYLENISKRIQSPIEVTLKQ